MVPGLITKNVVQIKSDIGSCKIELCVGDITKLRREEKVDVLVVSAFPGDYVPTPTSLIGQLQMQLNISVEDLSKDKEEDLREVYFCWWSKLLQDQYSYKRVLCFEGGFGGHGTSPPRVIGAIFRCLVPILKNKGGSVIMPLITTGDQGYPPKLVLKQILKAAVNWIKSGLPLQKLKIVAFSRNPDKEDKTFEPLFNIFENYVVENKPEQEIVKVENGLDVNTIFISHCHKDHNTAVKLKELLEEKGLMVYNDIQEVNDKEPWQDGIYRIMVNCSSIVVLLSKDYLASESCLEQYNMALCISRRKFQKVFAFLFIQNEPNTQLPTYVGQMHIFRENDETKVRETAETICQQLQITRTTTYQCDVQAVIEELQPSPKEAQIHTLSNNLDIPYGVQIVAEGDCLQETECRAEGCNGSVRLSRESAAIRTENEAKTPCEQDEN